MPSSIKKSFAPSSSTQRNQKHFFLFFLVVAGGRTAWGESCWCGVAVWGVAGCGMPSGGSPTFHVRTTCPSCSRKSCSTLKREGDDFQSVSYLCLNKTLTNFRANLFAIMLVYTSTRSDLLFILSTWRTQVQFLF